MVNQSSDLDRVFGALSDATRRHMIRLLSRRDRSASELARPFPISLPAVSKHLRVLEGAGLIRRRVEGRVHVFSVNAGRLNDAAAWLKHYREFWESRIDRLDRYLKGVSGRR